jgi:hypothetical protein
MTLQLDLQTMDMTMRMESTFGEEAIIYSSDLRSKSNLEKVVLESYSFVTTIKIK